MQLLELWRKKAIENDYSSDVDLADTFIGQFFDNEIIESHNSRLPEIQTDYLPENQTDSSTSDRSPPRSQDQGHDTLSRSQLIQEQQKDPEISNLFHRALNENETSQVPVCYYKKNGILMRKWRPPDVSAADEWTVNHQIVVPRSYRQEILSLAHEIPMSSHLGVNKTYHKICLLYTSPSPRDLSTSRMPSSA